VEVNGQTFLAGAAFAEKISAKVDVLPGIKEGWVRVAGDIAPDNAPPADAEWLSRRLSVGEAVVIRIIEADRASSPVLSRSDPSVHASDGVKLVCSFCGKSHNDVQNMYSGDTAMICNECVALLHQISADDSG
jgi:hypothetical protein